MNASENQIVVYQPSETVRLDVRLENETVWLWSYRLNPQGDERAPRIRQRQAAENAGMRKMV